MTTRHRRNKQERASDVLRALLKIQEADVATHKAALEMKQAQADRTRRALEVLGQEMLPGFKTVEESARIGTPVQPNSWPCFHSHTSTIDGVRRCVDCNERILYQGE